MWRAIQIALRRLQAGWDRRPIERALKLIGQGDVRSDGLRLDRACHRLEIRWRARDIHPWDRDLPRERQAAVLAELALADTEAAIMQLFEALPQVDVIDLAVLEPQSDRTMMAGTVSRPAAIRVDEGAIGSRRLLSVKMRLSELGVQFRMDAHFETLDTGRNKQSLRCVSGAE
jgi:hypothetical protein